MNVWVYFEMVMNKTEVLFNGVCCMKTAVVLAFPSLVFRYKRFYSQCIYTEFYRLGLPTQPALFVNLDQTSF